MPQPQRSDVHVNKPLTNISIAYIQKPNDFVADKVFPVVPVMKQSDLYFQYDKKYWFQSQSAKRAPGTESAGSNFAVAPSGQYFCNVWANHKDVDDQTRQNADQPVDLDRDATQFCTQQNLLRREKEWVGAYMKTGIWTGAPDFTPNTLWSAAGSDPVNDIETLKSGVKEKTGFDPNCLVLSRDVFSKLKSNASILDRMKYTQRAVLTVEILASLFDLEKVLIANAVEDTAPVGQASVMSFLVAKKFLLAYAAPAPSILQPSAGYTFAWQGLFGAGALGARVSSFRMEHLKSDRIEAEQAYDLKQVSADLGVLGLNVIA